MSVSDFCGGAVEVVHGCGCAGGVAASTDSADHVGEVAVAHDLLAVGEGHDRPVDGLDLVALEREANLLAAALHRVTARMLAEHERRLRNTNFLGPHDLVG